MKENLSILKNTQIFSGIDENEISSLLVCLQAKKETYKKGSYILRAGDSIAEIGVLLNGNLLVIQEDFWGNCNLLLKITVGQLFAESYACSLGAYINFSVTAEENSEVLWLNTKRIFTTCSSACSHHSLIIRNLLSDVAGKNLRYNEKLTHMSQRTTRAKLLSYLSAVAQKQCKSEFDIPFTRQQLADYLSVERSAMSAELCKLRDSGILNFEKNHFILHIPQLLATGIS